MGMGQPLQGRFPNSVTGARARLGLELDLMLDYGASGSIQNTTGTTGAGSNSLALASPIDFKNGQGISIVGAGPAATQTDGVTPLAAPTSLTITPTGGTGTTAYKYWVVALDVGYGHTDPISAEITNGEATLSASIYNALSWPAVTGAAGYIVWGDASNPANSQGLLGITAVGGMANSFDDVGFGPLAYIANAGSVPPYFPLTVPSSAIGDTLITTVQGGGGTNRITLAAYASNSVSGAYVGHSDADVYIQFLNDCVAQNRSGHIPLAGYIIDKTVNPDWAQVSYGPNIYSEQATLYFYPVVSTESAGGVTGYAFALFTTPGFTGLVFTDVIMWFCCRTGGFIIPSPYSQKYCNIRLNIHNRAGQAVQMQNMYYSKLFIYAEGRYSPDTTDCSAIELNNCQSNRVTTISASGGTYGTCPGSHALSLSNCFYNKFTAGLAQDLYGSNSALNTDTTTEYNVFDDYSFTKLLNANLPGVGNIISGSAIYSLDTPPNPASITIIGGPYDNYPAGGSVVAGSGVVSMFAGTLANRPAAGSAGRFYFATDNQACSYDTGSAWENVTIIAIPATVNTANGTGFVSAAGAKLVTGAGGMTWQISPGANGSIGFLISGLSGQGADILAITDYLSNILAAIGPTGQIISNVATGTAPLSVASTTEVANLNAERWGGTFAGSTSTTATAGSATLPANPAGFVEISINGTTYKVPYYDV